MSRSFRLASVLGLLALVWACYGGSLSNGWVWDDHAVIEHNELLARPRTFVEAARLLARPERGVEGAARPVFVLSLLADRRLWGLEPAGFHLTNLVLHAAVSCLVLALASALGAPPAAALLAAAVFAAHPAYSEAVSLPTFRPDLLAALFMLLSLLAFLRARGERSAGRAAAWLAACALAYLLGLLSKEMAATVPALALLCEAALRRAGRAAASRRLLLASLLLYAAAAGAYAAYRSGRSGYAALRGPAAPAARGDRVDGPPLNRGSSMPSRPQWEEFYSSRKTRALTTAGILAEYQRLLLWPAALQADRAPRLIRSFADARLWLSLAALAAWALLALAAWRLRAAAAFFGLAWCAVAVSPVSNLVRIYNPVAERYLYAVGIGFALAAGWALSACAARLWAGRRRAEWAPALGALVVLPLAARTVAREKDWRSDAALFGAQPQAAEDTARVAYNLGVEAQRKTDWPEAARRYERALELNPKYLEAMVNLAGVRERQDRFDEALSLYQRALALKPASDKPYLLYGHLLELRGRPDDAYAVYSRLLKEHPEYATAWMATAEMDRKRWLPEALERHLKEAVRRDPAVRPRAEYLMGLAYLDAADARRGPYEPAQRHLAEALRLAPDDPDAALNLGVAYHHGGKPQKAVEAFWRARKLAPASAVARYDLAAALIDLGRLKEAERDLSRAVDLSEGYLDAWYTLGLVRARLGKVPGAFAAWRTALKLNPKKVEVLANLGALEEQAGDPRKAVELDERALALDPQTPFLRVNYGNALMKAGRPSDAAQAYSQAADRARAAGDTTTLQTALANLAAAQKALGR